jgi:hypothetical protein
MDARGIPATLKKKKKDFLPVVIEIEDYNPF